MGDDTVSTLMAWVYKFFCFKEKFFNYNFADYFDQETICRIVEWIVDIEYRPKSINLRLMQFDPDWYSVDNCEKLISTGFNPKWQLYAYGDEKKLRMATKTWPKIQRT